MAFWLLFFFCSLAKGATRAAMHPLLRGRQCQTGAKSQVTRLMRSAGFEKLGT